MNLQTLATNPQSEEIESLREVSARLGRDPLLVQASSGNTSIKLNGTLWIKASGKWLARAAEEDMLVPVELNGTPPSSAIMTATGLVPSVETPMHTVIPVPATIHVHSVNAIAWGVLRDGAGHVAKRLEGLEWAWIPYVLSGLPLAREVERIFDRAPATRILILANHGLVVCGDDPIAAERLLYEVEARLAVRPRPAPKPDRGCLERLIQHSEWRPAECDIIHALSTDETSRAIVTNGILYPCQALYVGRNMPMLPPSLPLSDGIRGHEDRFGARPSFFLVEGRGVIVNPAMPPAEREVLRGLAEVTQRIDSRSEIRCLSDSEIQRLLEADSYRLLG